MAPYYYRVGKVNSTLSDWELIDEHDNNIKISLRDAKKNGLYIQGRVETSGRLTYMPVTDIERRFKGSPVLTYIGGKIDLKTVVLKKKLYFGPSYDENADDEKKGLKEDNDHLENEQKRGEEETKKAQQRATKRLEDALEQESKKEVTQEALRRNVIEQTDGGSVTPTVPVQSVATQVHGPAAPAAAAAAPAGGGDLQKGFHDYMKIMHGGKRKKSRKPKRRNSRSKRRNSRSKRRNSRSNRTLNKSKK
jgi:hypothetical protein